MLLFLAGKINIWEVTGNNFGYYSRPGRLGTYWHTNGYGRYNSAYNARQVLLLLEQQTQRWQKAQEVMVGKKWKETCFWDSPQDVNCQLMTDSSYPNFSIIHLFIHNFYLYHSWNNEFCKYVYAVQYILIYWLWTHLFQASEVWIHPHQNLLSPYFPFSHYS